MQNTITSLKKHSNAKIIIFIILVLFLLTGIGYSPKLKTVTLKADDVTNKYYVNEKIPITIETAPLDYKIKKKCLEKF